MAQDTDSLQRGVRTSWSHCKAQSTLSNPLGILLWEGGSKLSLWFLSSLSGCYLEVADITCGSPVLEALLTQHWFIWTPCLLPGCLLGVGSVWWWRGGLANLSASLCSVLLWHFQWPYEFPAEALCSWHRADECFLLKKWKTVSQQNVLQLMRFFLRPSSWV